MATPSRKGRTESRLQAGSPSPSPAERPLPGAVARVPRGPQKTKQFRRKKEAELFLDAIRGDLAHGRYVDPAGGLIPFRDYAEQWRLGQVHRSSTAAQAESYLRLHAYPFLGHRPLGSIRRSEVQSWVKGHSEVLAPGSVEVVYRWVAAIFKTAVGDQLIGASPCNRIALSKREDGEVVPLTAAQVQQMADACPHRYRALVVLAAGTGLRQGECFGLSVDRVDFLHRQVRVNRQYRSLQRKSSHTFIEQPPGRSPQCTTSVHLIP